MKIKYNQILALRDGIKQGAVSMACGLAPSHHYFKKYEYTAFDYGFSLGCTPAGLAQWKSNSNELKTLEYFINCKAIKPAGWKISRVKESDLQPFVEEI